jgi:hypothetical protein
LRITKIIGLIFINNLAAYTTPNLPQHCWLGLMLKMVLLGHGGITGNDKVAKEIRPSTNLALSGAAYCFKD